MIWLLLFVLLASNPVRAQEIVNLIAPAPEQPELVKYAERVEMKWGTKKRAKAHTAANINDVMKPILADAILSRLNNPHEFAAQLHSEDYDTGSKFRISKSDVVLLFHERDRYSALDFDHKKYFLRDLFWAPIMVIGTVTRIDTMCFVPNQAFPVLKIQMSDLEAVNKYDRRDLKNKRTEFIFATWWRAQALPEWLVDPEHTEDSDSDGFNDVPDWGRARGSHDFEIEKRYLVFIFAQRVDSKCLRNTPEHNLPVLHVTTVGTECFPVEQSELIDVNGYFGKGNRVAIEEVKSTLDSVMDEIVSWIDKK